MEQEKPRKTIVVASTIKLRRCLMAQSHWEKFIGPFRVFPLSQENAPGAGECLELCIKFIGYATKGETLIQIWSNMQRELELIQESVDNMMNELDRLQEEFGYITEFSINTQDDINRFIASINGNLYGLLVIDRNTDDSHAIAMVETAGNPTWMYDPNAGIAIVPSNMKREAFQWIQETYAPADRIFYRL